jgi:hypothetical protein
MIRRAAARLELNKAEAALQVKGEMCMYPKALGVVAVQVRGVACVLLFMHFKV